MVKKNLCGLTADEIFSLIGSSGFSLSHAVSITNNIYKKRGCEVSQFTGLSNKLKDVLSKISFCRLSIPVAAEVSSDKTVKYLFRTEDEKEFETVLIPDNNRTTVCVSTQSGCRMGCSYCVTAKYGFHGNLSAGEIVNQIISIPDARKVTHIVFMGMGEPMDNIENVLKACKIITAEWGLAFSHRNVTVSTVGITPGIEKFLVGSDCNLTLSLHSPFTDERKKIVPAERHYPVLQIIELMKKFPVKKNRRFSISYVMIKDFNDTDDHLEKLKNLLNGSQIRVNLLPYHQVGKDKYMSSEVERMQFFKHNLVISGISASVRKSRGIDISAACGLLATGLNKRVGLSNRQE